MTSNILLINNGRILAEGDVHQIRDLIDEHPHTVYVRAENPRGLAREFLDARRCAAACGSRTGAVVVETGKPDAFYARLTELAASGEFGAIEEVTSPDDNLQAVFQYLVKNMTRARRPRAVRACPAAAAALPDRRACASSTCRSGEMLWSRRTIFMALVVGAPVLHRAHPARARARSAAPVVRVERQRRWPGRRSSA